MKDILKIKLIGIGLACVAVGLFVFAKMKAAKNEHIEKEGIAVKAVPTKLFEVYGNRGSKTYSLNITFPSKTNPNQTATIPIDKELADKFDTLDFVEIKYLPDDPTAVHMKGAPFEKPAMVWMSLSMLICGIACTGYGFSLARKESATALDGNAG